VRVGAEGIASAPPARAEPGHLAHLDGLRAIAALYVALTHVVLIAAPVHHGTRTEGGRPAWLPPGHYAVAVFIVLSGFCLTLPIVRSGGVLPGGARSFYRRRARRILPPYYGALLLTLVLVWTLVGDETGTFWDFSVPVTAAGYLGNLLLVQDVVGYWQVSVPFWSIAVECQIYLLLPLLVLCWRRYGAQRTVITTVYASYVVLVATYVAGGIGPFFVPGLTAHFVGLFALGMAAAWLASSDREAWAAKRQRLPWTALALSCGGAALVLTIAAGGLVDALAPFIELPIGLGVMCLLVATARAGRLRRALALRPLVFVGTFSYSLYLIHAPLLQAEWQYALRPLDLGAPFTLALLGLVGLPLTVGAAYAFFLVCERPFMSARQRRAAGRGSAHPVAATPARDEGAPSPGLLVEPEVVQL
jgi:peptidoglycan/LPS O-acetylase OafA/YrhL